MKTIGIRDFLRGGYQQIEGTTLVMSHSRPVGIWMPYDAEKVEFDLRPSWKKKKE